MKTRRRSAGAGRYPGLVAVGVLRAYKYIVSPWLRPACRYYPTCAEYAMEAVERHGVLGGSRRAVSRLLRCHPLGPGGVDLVD